MISDALPAGAFVTRRQAIDILQETVTGLKGDVEHITERLPDPTHGPLDKVRDALSGRGEAPAHSESQ